MAFDQNGIATVATATGLFDTDEVKNRLRSIEVQQVSFANLVDGVLREMTDAAQIVIDPVSRRVYAAPAEDAIDVNVAHTAASVLQPESGQEGRSLTWEAGTDTGAGIPNKSALIAPTDAVKPVRSVSSLVGAVLTALGAITPEVAEADQPVILVDQEAGVVKLIKPTNRTTALSGLDSAISGSLNGVKITMSEPSVEGEPDPLIFEGGPTS
jgi:hypothetical protein